MQASDRENYTAMMQALGATFGRDCDEPTLAGYWLAVSDLPVDALKRAVMRAIRECDRMPSGKQLRKLAGELDNDARAVLAWQSACDSIQAHGAYRHVDFDDRIINATIRTMGGWPKLISRFEKDREEFIRRDFLNSYQSLLASRVDGEVCRPLAGISEASVVDGKVSQPLIERIETGLPMLPSPNRDPRIGRRPDLSMKRLEATP